MKNWRTNRRTGKKYVLVSGRSSHTVTAENEEDAKKKFKRLFPYAHVRFVTEIGVRVPIDQINIRNTFAGRHVHPSFADYDRKSIEYHKRLLQSGGKFEPIELRKVSSGYEVRDGWHRLMALKELGQKEVLAEVTS